MTIDEVVAIVREETGHEVSPETCLDKLDMDSLDFLELLVHVGVPNEVVPRINTVNDLWLASEGQLV